jgi:hypothetical protein
MAAGDNRGVIVHANLKGNQVHEPKNVETADENTVYFADGDGSGRWQPITPDKLSLELQVVNRKYQGIPEVPDTFSLIGFAAGITGSVYDVDNFLGSNKNTKELANKLNLLIEAVGVLNTNVNNMRAELSELEDRLQALKLIEVM